MRPNTKRQSYLPGGWRPWSPNGYSRTALGCSRELRTKDHDDLLDLQVISAADAISPPRSYLGDGDPSSPAARLLSLEALGQGRDATEGWKASSVSRSLAAITILARTGLPPASRPQGVLERARRPGRPDFVISKWYVRY